ncbi:MAG: JAB domain-containing protein [Lentisphaerae bacterium]|jgi:DNA repair protein RadC|nr:JAB domain-containing protein [Lentisphaerota bacterium]
MTTMPVRKGRSVWEYSLTRRKALEMREGERAKCPEDIARFLRSLEIQNEEQERFLTIILDAKNAIKGFFTVVVGLIDRAPLHAREVFRTAILQGASKVILAHQHPSGDPTPSAQDIACTREVVAAGKIIGIEVMDHIILGLPSSTRSRDYISFREENLL